MLTVELERIGLSNLCVEGNQFCWGVKPIFSFPFKEYKIYQVPISEHEGISQYFEVIIRQSRPDKVA